ncbi:MAG: glycosyltransferase family 4 protein [Candidatus Dojkabacteria bacterium]|nr:glycosyltransferase family 4 protein [Candidatus Dojkabacteria bacterium]
MKIGIDYSPAVIGWGGISYYTKELTKSLIKRTDHYFYIFVANLSHVSEIPLKGINFEVIEVPAKKYNYLWILKVYLYTRKLNLDAFISTLNILFSILIRNSYQIIHDIFLITHPEYYSVRIKTKLKYLINLALLLRRSFLFISDYTRKSFCDVFKTNIHKDNIIYGGINTSLINAKDIGLSALASKYGIKKEYILSVSTLEPRKNYTNALKAFSIVKHLYSDIQYVIVGKKGWLYQDIFDTVEALSLQDYVIFTDYVTLDELKTLYINASVFLMLSWQEGLGLPILEAIYFKKSVVASNIEAFREIKHDLIHFVNPAVPEDIAQVLLRLLQDKKTQNTDTDNCSIDNIEFFQKYSWDTVANKVLDIIEKQTRADI